MFGVSARLSISHGSLSGFRVNVARYKKIVYRQQALDELLTDLFLEAHPEPPARIVLDLDATDDPVHGISRS